MTQLGDFHVKHSTSEPRGDPPIRMTVAAVVAILVIGTVVYWFFGRGADPEPPPAVATDTLLEAPVSAPVEPPPAPVELPELPGLDVSDAFVGGLVAALSAHPDLATWLVSDDLVRRFVVVVDNIAEGRNPSQHVTFMRPDTGFRVTGGDASATIDPRTYQRYDMHAQIVDSFDTQGTAELYLTLESLMDEAYVELGYPDTRFRDTFTRAITHLLDTPVVDEPPAVVRRGPFYEHLDGSLEALTPVQKQLIGMGPENMRTVQAKLLAISRAIGISTDR